jgi:putative ABC transport system permease protein
MFLLQQIKKELIREKTRIILTVIAIAWGTFAIASMLAIGEGLRLTFIKTMANTGQNLLMMKGGRTSKIYRGTHAGMKINLTKKDYKEIAGLPNVAAISPAYTLAQTISHRDAHMLINMQTLAVSSTYNKIHNIRVLPGGRFISPLDIKQRKAVIVLGEQTAKDLFPQIKNPTGKITEIGSKPFLIIGVMQHKSQIIAHQAPDAFSNWIPFSTYELYNNPPYMDSIDLTYKNPNLLPELESHIWQIIALNHGADPSDDNLAHFFEFAKRQQKITDFFLGMQVFLGIIGFLTLIVAGVGITNVMYVSINRATREIGIRMAIGAKTYQILAHYIAEGLTVAFIGGLLGLSMSALLVYGLKQIPLHGRLIRVIGQPHPELSLTVILIVVLTLSLIGFLAGLFPALKAASIDPTEALGYE